MSQHAVYLGVPTYGGTVFSNTSFAIFCALNSRLVPSYRHLSHSLLGHAFNLLYKDCMDQRHAKKLTHFCMLHSDVQPMRQDWLPEMLGVMDKGGYHMFSAVVPIKTDEGYSSTGYDYHNADGSFKDVRKIPMSVFKMGEVFEHETLVINTGCLLIDLRHPAAKEVSFEVYTELSHDGHGNNYKTMVESEDWRLTRKMRKLGMKIGAYRMPIVHWGMKAYGDDLSRTDDIEGWLTTPEKIWLEHQGAFHRTIVELGSWHGLSTSKLASQCRGTVYAVDHFKGSDAPDVVLPLRNAGVTGTGAKARIAFKRNLAEHLDAGRVVLIEKASVDAGKAWPSDKPIDMLWIDADHSYESVKQDLMTWLPYVRSGGLVCGHDVNETGVVRAVEEVCGKVTVAVDTIWEYIKP